ncbi:MAG TPA: hypothetical protein VLL77_11380 [Anaerolineales bacterium]|nr:hypothetical protein [Anaerolineales bacterium]
MDLTGIHGALSFSFMLYMILAAGWILAAAVRPGGRPSTPESSPTEAMLQPPGGPAEVADRGSPPAAPRGSHVSSSTWGILVIGELLALAQVVIGLVLSFGGASPGRSVHWLYGATAVLTLPGYYAISRGRDDRTASFIYAGLCAFLVFIGYRAGVTGI